MFHKETEYALRSLVYIQVQQFNNRRPVVAEIAKEIGAPPFYTAKILQRLARDGFVNSTKGRGGGFFFGESKPDVQIKDIILAVQGCEALSGCGYGLKECNPLNPCPLHVEYFPIRDALIKMAATETIKSLALKYIHGNEGNMNPSHPGNPSGG